MDDFISISLLSLAMLVGCYVAGIVPLAVNFSEERLKLVTVLGAGLLCGTALAVIVPEGVHALYEDILEDQTNFSPHFKKGVCVHVYHSL
uniref:Zinc transporter ZIP9 n=1 Tax=Suricata suricatta TaxID=37032 RepID=A0A673T9G5_SURSU